jgi:hypothetical protein
LIRNGAGELSLQLLERQHQVMWPR